MRILVTGATGQVGSEVVAQLARRAEAIVKGPELDVVVAGHGDLDVADRDAVLSTISELEPDVVIHPAAFTAVDACESDPDRAFAVNALGTRYVAEGARLVRAHVAYLSTDYVFDGTSPYPYNEWSPTRPLSIYGASKLAGERELDRSATIVRTSWVCGVTGKNMVKTVLRLATTTDGPLRFVDDQTGCPTMADDLAEKLVELALARRAGIFHVTNQGATTWYGFAREVLSAAGLEPRRVEPITTAELDPARYPAPRPANSVLDNAALRLGGLGLLPRWQESLRRVVEQLPR